MELEPVEHLARLFTPVPLEREGMPLDAIAVSDSRMLAAARVTPLRGGRPALESFLVFSMHARWRPCSRLPGDGAPCAS